MVHVTEVVGASPPPNLQEGVAALPVLKQTQGAFVFAKACIQEYCDKHALAVQFDQLHCETWPQFLNAQAFTPIVYSASQVVYQQAYLAGFGGCLHDISLTISKNGTVVAIWPLHVYIRDQKVQLGSNEGPVLPPLLSDALGARERQSLTSVLADLLMLLMKTLHLDRSLKTVEYGYLDYVTEWHAALMAHGALLSVKHDLYIDLGYALDRIKSGFRKSYRSLINSSQKHWTFEIISTANTVVWAEFIALHLAVAGRQTRSEGTWALQLDSLKKGEAFLITLRDALGKLSGAGFFQHTKDEGIYAVAAYDRAFFHLPMGHLVQWQAIQEFKRLGLKWYRVGERAYLNDIDKPDEKWMKICDFKEGFATHIKPRWVSIFGESRLETAAIALVPNPYGVGDWNSQSRDPKFESNHGRSVDKDFSNTRALLVQGDGLYLQVLLPEAVGDEYVAWMSDPDVIRFLESRHEVQTLDKIQNFVRSTLNSATSILFGIYASVGDVHIGNIKLGPIDWANSRAEIGLMIGNKNHWGQGVGYRSIYALTQYAHQELRLGKLTAGCLGKNIASYRAFIKAGYLEEGRRINHFIYGEDADDLVLLGHIAPTAP